MPGVSAYAALGAGHTAACAPGPLRLLLPVPGSPCRACVLVAPQVLVPVPDYTAKCTILVTTGKAKYDATKKAIVSATAVSLARAGSRSGSSCPGASSTVELECCQTGSGTTHRYRACFA